MTANITIRRGRPGDIDAYLKISQRASELAYAHPSIDQYSLFAPEHYFFPSTLESWEAILANDGLNHWWVAESLSDRPALVGGIHLKKQAGRLEGSGFYVDPAYQGQGIGKSLWQTRQKLVDAPLYFEVFSHAGKTIAMHERHGAVSTGRQRLIHWDSWPVGVNLIALEYVQK